MAGSRSSMPVLVRHPLSCACTYIHDHINIIWLGLVESLANFPKVAVVCSHTESLTQT